MRWKSLENFILKCRAAGCGRGFQKLVFSLSIIFQQISALPRKSKRKHYEYMVRSTLLCLLVSGGIIWQKSRFPEML